VISFCVSSQANTAQKLHKTTSQTKSNTYQNPGLGRKSPQKMGLFAIRGAFAALKNQIENTKFPLPRKHFLIFVSG